MTTDPEHDTHAVAPWAHVHADLAPRYADLRALRGPRPAVDPALEKELA